MAVKKKFLLRLDADLYASLERWAADDLRSINAQMEFLLHAAVKTAGRIRSGGRLPHGPEAGEERPENGPEKN